ncbi:MAG: hypothetical protein AMXMBFR57_20150 [Acidimicrobiia bacterium]
MRSHSLLNDCLHPLPTSSENICNHSCGTGQDRWSGCSCYGSWCAAKDEAYQCPDYSRARIPRGLLRNVSPLAIRDLARLTLWQVSPQASYNWRKHPTPQRVVATAVGGPPAWNVELCSSDLNRAAVDRSSGGLPAVLRTISMRPPLAATLLAGGYAWMTEWR